MVASINDGEGSLKNIYTVTAYAVSPYIIITPFVVLLSYFVTYNEAFILQLIWFIGVAWSAVLLFLAVKQTHNYNVGETVKNILLTIYKYTYYLIYFQIITVEYIDHVVICIFHVLICTDHVVVCRIIQYAHKNS